MEEITQDDVMATYKVLEYLRDDLLEFPGEKAIVNDAHCLVQECESGDSIPTDDEVQPNYGTQGGT